MKRVGHLKKSAVENCENESETENEPVYEVRGILDASTAFFPKKGLGYLVSWKGYGPQYNSWARRLNEAINDAKAGSTRALDYVNADTATSIPEKRGRTSASEKKDEQPPAKKGRSSSQTDTTLIVSGKDIQLQDGDYGPMTRHMHVSTWDRLIKNVDKGRSENDILYVYFTLHGGERVREESGLCAAKFPKTIKFYVSKLRDVDA
ncbi:hypothetical protein C8R47DRAFT_1120598 [Mycena vitilis]|nr:hypothetical protein C8R47DRAFT_1120598 [Mycena vitilis]